MKRTSLKHRMINQIMGGFMGIFLAVAFFHTFSLYQVVGNGMQDTLNDGQYVLVIKVAYLLHGPKRGDIVVLHDPTNTNREWIKRIIGLPGDSITLTHNGVSANGVQLTEPYVTIEDSALTTTVKVPSDEYFVLGDNRPVSKDSRSFGFVAREDIIGPIVVVRVLLEISLCLCTGAVVCLLLVVQYKKAKKSRRLISPLPEDASK